MIQALAALGPMLAKGAGIAGQVAGGAGGLMSGLGQMFGLGGGGAPTPPGSGTLNHLLENSKFSELPFYTSHDLAKSWKTGQLPRPLQRSLQALQPALQAMYAGTTDQLSMGANAGREDIARRYAAAGLTGPQLTKALSDIDMQMRLGDLAARKQAGLGYAQALSAAHQDVYSRGFSEPREWFSIGQGGGGGSGSGMQPLAGYLQGAGNMLQQGGRGLYNYFAPIANSTQPSVPNYSQQIGQQFGGWTPTMPNTEKWPSVSAMLP